MATAHTRDGERLRVAWEVHQDKLWRAVLGMVAATGRSRTDAVAEAFAQAARRGDAIDDVGRWVWRAVVPHRRRPARGATPGRHRCGRCTSPVTPTRCPTTWSRSLDCLDRLPARRPRGRRARDVGGWTAGEIAALTDSTAGAVRVRLHRARRRLRRELEERDE